MTGHHKFFDPTGSLGASFSFSGWTAGPEPSKDPLPLAEHGSERTAAHASNTNYRNSPKVADITLGEQFSEYEYSHKKQ